MRRRASATGTGNFGKAGAATHRRPGVLNGWGVRPSDYQYDGHAAAADLLPRVSADFSYTHRTFHGFFVTDDLNRATSSDGLRDATR